MRPCAPTRNAGFAPFALTSTPSYRRMVPPYLDTGPVSRNAAPNDPRSPCTTLSSFLRRQEPRGAGPGGATAAHARRPNLPRLTGERRCPGAGQRGAVRPEGNRRTNDGPRTARAPHPATHPFRSPRHSAYPVPMMSAMHPESSPTMSRRPLARIRFPSVNIRLVSATCQLPYKANSKTNPRYPRPIHRRHNSAPASRRLAGNCSPLMKKSSSCICNVPTQLQHENQNNSLQLRRTRKSIRPRTPPCPPTPIPAHAGIQKLCAQRPFPIALGLSQGISRTDRLRRRPQVVGVRRRWYSEWVAPVAQWIEHRPPEPGAGVRVAPGALRNPCGAWRSGSALGLGPRGRQFNPARPDHPSLAHPFTLYRRIPQCRLWRLTPHEASVNDDTGAFRTTCARRRMRGKGSPPLCTAGGHPWPTARCWSLRTRKTCSKR